MPRECLDGCLLLSRGTLVLVPFFSCMGTFVVNLRFSYFSVYCSCTVGNPDNLFVDCFQNVRFLLKSKKFDNKYFKALAFKFIRSEEREDQWKAIFLLVQGSLKSFAKTVEFFNNVFSYTPSNSVAKQGNSQTFELFLWLLITHFCTGLSHNNDPAYLIHEQCFLPDLS